ncbi:MAG TPA: tetratricopeptide repeat protein [Gallionellaceae bacterium]
MLDHASHHLQHGKAEQALPLLTQHCIDHPRDAFGWFLLGACHHQLNQLPQALQAFEQVLALEPRHVQARSAKGVILSAMGRPQDALQVFRKALHLVPSDVQLLLNIAVLHEQLGDRAAALQRYDQALACQPTFPAAMLNRGTLLLRLQRLDEALANNRKLVELHPNWEQAQFNLGEVCLALGRWQDAKTAYAQALTLAPQMAKAQFGLGLALAMLQRFDESQQAFDRARKLDQTAFASSLQQAAALTGGELREFTPRTLYLLRESANLEQCDWHNWEQYTATFASMIQQPPAASSELSEPALLFRTFALALPGHDTLKLARHIAHRLAEQHAPLCPLVAPAAAARKIRIGYVSPDFRNHPTARLTRRLYALHDRNQFEVYGYSLHPGDNSPLRRDIEQGCDTFRELSGLDARAAADIIQRDRIDILIDLAGYTTRARPEIFAQRPAPLQACYLGFPHSTGADYMDYFIGDPIIIPSQLQSQFSEHIAYLPECYFLFDNQQAIADMPQSRAAHSLPEQGVVFCCFNNSNKITPHDFDLWMELLKRLPNSVLWLLSNNPVSIANLRKEAAQRGVHPERLVFAGFLPNEQHVARYRLADLFLDTRYYNAHTTAAEALWSGLPVLTCAGNSMAARVASSLLQAAGLPELVTTTPDQYLELAFNLALDRRRLQSLRQRLTQQRANAALFATERQVAHLEALYHAMWQRHLGGQAVQTLHLAR